VSATCPSCGEVLPERARFCPACAAPVSAGGTAAPERRVVSVFFSDVAGSTELGERLDPEAVRRVMNRYFAAVSAALERHGGRIQKFIGDAVVALFGVPVAHEDDALRCVRAAFEARDAVRALGDELDAALGVRLGVRIGVATGEVVIGTAPGGHQVATGDTMNTAARLEAAAPVGGVLIGAATHQLVRDQVDVEAVAPLALKGKTERVTAYRLVGLRSGSGPGSHAAATPMVGRVRERRMLQDAYDRSAEERSCQLVTVLGTAGVGKSRLVGEFLAGLGDAAGVAGGRCLSYGEGITYWALAEAVKGLAGIRERDSPDEVRGRLVALAGVDAADEVGSLLGLAGANARIEDARAALRRMLEDVARERPVVLVLDDIHCAEPPLLDLIDYLADWITEAPVLLLCMARPELLDERAGWGGGKLNATSLLLEPLSDADSGTLVRGLLGERISAVVADRITATAEGNPLYVEELIGMLADDGHLRRTETGVEVTGTIDRLELPATIQALLTARLDRLSPDELGIVERASIEGQVFHLGTIAALGADPEVTRSAVPVLTRKQLFRSERAALPGQEAFRFRHLLIRDAAYERVAKEVRAEWHAVFADWMEALAGARLSEYEELLAHHLGQAAMCRREIGIVGAETEALARRAARLSRRAADRTLARGDFHGGAALLEDVVTLLPRGDPESVIVLADRAVSLVVNGDGFAAVDAARAAVEAAAHCGAQGAQFLAASISEWAQLVAGAGADALDEEAALARAYAAARAADGGGDAEGAVRLWVIVADWETLHFLRCRRGADAARRAQQLAASLGGGWLEMMGAALLGVATMRGPGRIGDLITRGEAAVRGQGRVTLVDFRLNCAGLRSQEGDAAGARENLAAADAIRAELGVPGVGFQSLAGLVLLDLGLPSEAVDPLRRGLARHLDTGDVGAASSIAGSLARALALLGRPDEAMAVSDRARSLASPRDVASQIWWRGASARSLAALGRGQESAALADEIVGLLADVEDPQIEFHAHLDAAEGYRAGGRLDDAARLLRDAIAVSEARGAHGFATQGRAALAGLMDAVAAPPGTPRPTG
jgi:class 3 adenylate cyclase/tetratricopeptide (TPR) repeat protein